MRRALAALGVVAAWTVLPAAVAGADAPYQTGWWSALQVGGAGGVSVARVPAPPNVPENGLYVSGRASSPTAFSGVRYGLSGPAAATLTLRVAGGSASGVPVDACPLDGTWRPGPNQSMDAAPTPVCERLRVPGEVAGDGSSISWKLPADFFDAGKFGMDVGLVPGGDAPAQVAFEEPGPESFTPAPPPAAATAAEPLPAPGSAPAPAPDATGADAPAAAAGGGAGSGAGSGSAQLLGALPGAGSGSAVVPAATDGALAAPGGAGDTTSLPAAGAAAPPAAVTSSPAGAIVGGARHGGRGQRILAVALLAALAACLWWLGARPQRGPRRLGGMSPATAGVVDEPAVAGRVGGIGRFARPRTSAPRPL